MTYAVGTHIDLRYLNELKPQPKPEADYRTAAYIPGTRVLFVKNLHTKNVLKVTNKLLVVSYS